MQPLTQIIDIRPWLSLLIPAYEFPEGVIRILDQLPRNYGVQCLIGDDSGSDCVELAVLQHPAHRAGLVQYRRNRPALGPANNWNQLLASAQGDHILFMHHDEFPASPNFFQGLKEELRVVDDATLVVLRCWLPCTQAKWRLHMPAWFQRGLLQIWPDHLLRHNSWGSPSTVVAPRRLAPEFDASLSWLIDVDWFQRMLDKPDTSVSFSELSVISVPRSELSITARLRPHLEQLTLTEARHIADRRGLGHTLRIQCRDTIFAGAVSRVEMVIWRGARALLRLMESRVNRPGLESKGEP